MATTNFVDHSTIIEASWLNEVDNLVHDIFNNPSTAADTLTALGIVSSIPELNLLSGKADVLESADIGTTVQAYDATILKDADIGSTVQGYDADTAKYDAVTANFTGTLQNGGSNVLVDSDIGGSVASLGANTFAGSQTITDAAVNTYLIVNAPTGYSASFRLRENGLPAFTIVNDAAVNSVRMYKYEGDGATLASYWDLDESGNVNLAQGTLKYGGKEVATRGANTFTAAQSIEVSAAENAHSLRIRDSGNSNDLLFRSNPTAGNTNPLTQADDIMLAFSSGGINTGALSIIPWSSTSTGIRIDGSAHTVNITGTLQSDGVEVATVKDYSNSNTTQLNKTSDTALETFLSVSGLPVGAYKFTAFVYIGVIGGGNFKLAINDTNANIAQYQVTACDASSNVANLSVNPNNATFFSSFGLTGSVALKIEGFVNVNTATGTVTLQFAQASSNATGLDVDYGYMQLSEV